jgi:hypothetical protein
MSTEELEENGIYRIDPDAVGELSNNDIPQPLLDQWKQTDGYIHYIPNFEVQAESTIDWH